MTLRIVLQGVRSSPLPPSSRFRRYLAMNAREPGYLAVLLHRSSPAGFATNTQASSGQPWWFYLPIVIGGGLPWIVYVVLAGRKAPPYTTEPPTMFLWTWLVGAIISLSLSVFKAVTYVLPAMPAIAILGGNHRSIRRRGEPGHAVVATAAIYALALAVFGPSARAGAFGAGSSRDYFNRAGRCLGTIFVSTSASHSSST